jgi:hypothetical protein
MEEQIGFIYILTNKAFPELLKIGYTLRTVEERVQELSSASDCPMSKADPVFLKLCVHVC